VDGGRFRFENQVLDIARRELRRGDVLVPLEPQVFDLLAYVIRNRDRVVSKDDLVEAVWNGRAISDSTLTTRINAMRKALGDSGEEQRLIRTVARKGIRFVGTVTEGEGATSSIASAEQPVLALPGKPSIAVLPFQNLSSDPEQDHFCDGMVEEIVTDLSCSRTFFVIARASTEIYKDKPVDIRRASEELGVRYLLQGSVRSSGSRIRISVQLIDATTGVHIWANRYDRDLVDTFAVQDEITSSIAASIEPQLYAVEEARSRAKPPSSLDAWSHVVRATNLLYPFAASRFVEAEPLLRAAIEADPGYGRPRALLGLGIAFGAHLSFHPQAQVRYELASTLAREAIDRDAHDPWAYLALATSEVRRGNYVESEAALRQAIDLSPSFVLGHRTLGVVLAYMGRAEQARRALDTAIRLNPLDPTNQTIHTSYAMSYLVEGNLAEARREAEEGVRARPDYTGGRAVLICALVGLGEVAGARAVAQDLLRLAPTASTRHFAVGHYVEPHRTRMVEALRAAGLP